MKYADIIAKCNPSQNHEELNDLLIEVEKIKPKIILEIGVHSGGSVKVWQEVFKPDVLIGIDGKITPEFKAISNVYKIEGYSQDEKVREKVEAILAGREIDFMFIDGSHYYPDVKIDFLMYKPLMRSGGIIGFHDVTQTGDSMCQVNRFWQEILESRQYKTKTISHKDKYGITATGEGLIYL